jgi:uncharacterized phage infection (PIP) family protein YhgE
MCDRCVFRELKKIRKEIGKVMSKITDFAVAATAALTQANTSLDNIVADEANLSKQIADLQAQIANGSSVLTPEDQAALDAVGVSASALADRTKTAADAVPDLPTPPSVP